MENLVSDLIAGAIIGVVGLIDLFIAFFYFQSFKEDGFKKTFSSFSKIIWGIIAIGFLSVTGLAIAIFIYDQLDQNSEIENLKLYMLVLFLGTLWVIAQTGKLILNRLDDIEKKINQSK